MSKPNFIKEQQGTLEKSREKTPALIDTKIPIAPKEFNKYQKGIWGSVWEYLFINGVSQSIDYFLIKRYCVLLTYETELIKLVNKEGYSIEITNTKSKTNKVKNPHWMALMEVQTNIAQIEKQLGIGALNRDKINWKSKGEDSGFDDL